MPPSTSIGLPPSKKRPLESTGMSTHRRGVEREQLAQLIGAQIGHPVLAGADDRGRERLLPLDHRVDLLLQRAGADEFAYLHVPRLSDAECAIGGLVLD